MENYFGYVLDIILVIIFGITVFYFVKEGFVKGLINLIGKIFAIVIAFFVSAPLSKLIFDKLLRAPITDYLNQLVQDMGAQTLDEYLNSNASEIPGFLQGLLTQDISMVTDDLTSTIIQNYLEPLVTQIIAIILFILIYIIIVVIFGIVAKATKIIDKVPILGKANKALAFVLGAICAIIQTIFLLLIIWLGIQLYTTVISPGSVNIFENGILYSIFENILFEITNVGILNIEILDLINSEQRLLLNDLY